MKTHPAAIFTGLTLLILLLGAACTSENENGEPDIESGFWYDGTNFTAPVLPGGIYENAARYPASVTGTYAGSDLLAVHVYFLGRPFNVELRVYGPGSGNGEPGSLLLQQEVNRFDLAENGWTRIALDSPVSLDGSEIWIGFRYEHGGQFQSLGCDAGPRNPNGDFFLEGGTWTTFNAFTGTESINWNIRAEVE